MELHERASIILSEMPFKHDGRHNIVFGTNYMQHWRVVQMTDVISQLMIEDHMIERVNISLYRVIFNRHAVP